MPARFPAFLQITSRFHFQPTATGELARPTSFRLASSVVLARFLQLEFLLMCLWPADVRSFGGWRTPSSSGGKLRQEAASSTAASPSRVLRSARQTWRHVARAKLVASFRKKREKLARECNERHGAEAGDRERVAGNSSISGARLKRAGAAVGR